MAHLVWWLLLLLVARAAFLPWGRRSVLHDPLSALLALPEIAGIGEVAAVPAIAGGIGDIAGLGALAGGIGESAIGLGDLAGAAGAAGAAAGDIAGSSGLGPLSEIGLGAGAPIGDLSAAEANNLAAAVPGAAETPAGFQSLTGLAAGPSTTLPPVDVTAMAPASPAPIAPVAAPPTELLAAAQPTDLTAGLAPASTSADTVSGPLASATDTGPMAGATDVINADQGIGGGLAGSTGTNTGSLLSKVGLGGIEDFMSKNKGLVSAAGLALPLLSSLFQGKPNIPQLNVSNSAADAALAASQQQATVGNALQSASLNGVLPAGFQSAIDNAKSAAAARIRSGYAAVGMSGSTSEAQDLAASDAQISEQAGPILQNLMQQGIAATGAGISGETGAGSLALQQAELQLRMDDQLQQALSDLSKNLALSMIPSRLAA
jgi:hypothetical protein